MEKIAITMRLCSVLPWVYMGFWWWIFAISVNVYGLGGNLRFERVQEGSEAIKSYASALTSITQDQTGFMWFGGEHGLVRFDGVHFKYYEQSDREGALPSSYVRDLVTDAEGVMWVATDRGLARYHPQAERFEVYKPDYTTANSLPHNVVTSIAVDRHNNLILGTGSGISIVQQDRATYKNIPLTVDIRNVTFVFDTFVDSKHRIWVGTRDVGLFLLSPKGEFIRHFRADQNDPSALQSDTVKTIEEDQFGRIWVGTYGGGVSRINEGERSFTNYAYDPQKQGSIGSNTVWDIFLDSDDELWFSTDQGGLALYQQESDSFIHFRASIHDRFTLSSNQVRTIFEDRSDNLWIATFPNGIHFFDRAHSQVTNYSHKPDDPNSLSNSAVLNFLQTSDDILWIGTEAGLNQFDIDRKEFIGLYRHESNSDDGLAANSVLSLEEDFNGEIWIGTWSGGLHRLNRISQTFTHYGPTKNEKRYLNSAFIWDIYLDSHNTLWVATENGGLSRYDRSSDSFTSFVHDQRDPDSIASNFVWSVLEDRRGQFWVATADGLDIMDRERGIFYHFPKEAGNPKTLDSVRIRSLYEDRVGRIWIGTQDKGPYIYDPKTETFTRVSWPKSLSTLVTSFIEDNLDFVWASTANGIAQINPDTLEVRSFHKSDGLVGDNFNRDATFIDRKGQLYFGGTEGFSVFDPRVFARAGDDYPLVLTDFKLLNHSVTAGADGSPLEHAITYTDRIRLQHSHSMFSFDFAVLNYSAPFEHRFAYMLEGFDHQWHEVGVNHSATYTNIAPGTYTFKVMSSDRDGAWNKNSAEVELNIQSSPWRSMWAMAGYIMLILLLMGFLIRSFFKQMELNSQKALNVELLRVNKIKDAFLINTSHELRTPISTMIGLADAVLRDHSGHLPGNTKQHLALISGHGKRLFSLINDIVDYGNFSDHKLELNVEAVNVYEQVEASLELLRPFISDKPVQLVNAIDPDVPRIAADRNHLKQILTNLIGNVIKYTDTGEIRISAAVSGEKLVVDVRDTGCGFAADECAKILSAPISKPVTEQALTGVGLGLAVTQHLVELHGGMIELQSCTQQQATDELPAGTCFRITLPLSNQPSGMHVPPPPSPEPDKDAATAHTLELSSPAEIATAKQGRIVGDISPPEHAEQYRVLIVDDDPVNRLVLSGILSLHNYAVLEAGSGIEALNMIMHQGQLVDLIILDVMMPRMSGFDVCARLRQTYPKERLPIVFLTAKYGEEDVQKGLRVGGNEVLYKPVSKDVLLPRIKAYLIALAQYRGGILS